MYLFSLIEKRTIIRSVPKPINRCITQDTIYSTYSTPLAETAMSFAFPHKYKHAIHPRVQKFLGQYIAQAPCK